MYATDRAGNSNAASMGKVGADGSAVWRVWVARSYDGGRSFRVLRASDPIHLGHLILAEQCREACDLDRLWFVVAGSPPHKPDGRTPGTQPAAEAPPRTIAPTIGAMATDTIVPPLPRGLRTRAAAMAANRTTISCR